MTKVPSTWLNKEAIDKFIRRGSMETYEKLAHEAGEEILLEVVGRLSHKRKNFIIDINKQMVKDSYLEISKSSDRHVYEFCMLDRTETFYVGKKFVLVRGRKHELRDDENEEDRKRNINDEYKRVLRELYIWNKLRKSSNFVQLLHISLDDGRSITAVSEKFDRDLRHSLSTPGIDFAIIMKGIANALNFLHKFTGDIPIVDLEKAESLGMENVRGITHSDMKCVNVLLREGCSTPYLIDFGISHQQLVKGVLTKQLDTSGVHAIGTLPWMPPELLLDPSDNNLTPKAPDNKPNKKQKGKNRKVPVDTQEVPKNIQEVPDNNAKVDKSEVTFYTKNSDVWSFGMTIHEIVSRNDPWAQDVTKGLKAADIQGKIEEAMKRKDLPKWPDTIPQPLQKYSDSLCKLRNQCCKYRACERITMEKVVRELNKIFPYSRAHRERRV